MERALDIAARFVANEEKCAKLINGGTHVAAYPDPNWGWKVPTIGYGTTRYADGRKVQPTDVISVEQAAYELVMFIHDEIIPRMQRIPSWDQMNSNQRAALISFSYNLGPGWYKRPNRSSITGLVDSPERWTDTDDVRSTFVKYRSPGSRSENGLRQRRLREAALFLKETVDE